MKDLVDEYARYRSLGEKAIQQVSDESLNSVLGADNRELEVDKHPKRTVTRVQRESQEREESWIENHYEHSNGSCLLAFRVRFFVGTRRYEPNTTGASAVSLAKTGTADRDPGQDGPRSSV